MSNPGSDEVATYVGSDCGAVAKPRAEAPSKPDKETYENMLVHFEGDLDLCKVLITAYGFGEVCRSPGMTEEHVRITNIWLQAAEFPFEVYGDSPKEPFSSRSLMFRRRSS
ncbi:MAG: hypothetical protein JWN89_521 [Parcubacteria group bacterium]|nr:hypothetical protein [Parcubacteria group bacterium]